MVYLFLSENIFNLGTFIECDNSWFPKLNPNASYKPGQVVLTSST